MVSVGGKQNYSPFLKFAKFLKIPVFILSDGDDNTEYEVKEQINKVYTNLTDVPLFVLPNNTDYEKFLVESDFIPEILEAVDKIMSKDNYLEEYIDELNGQSIDKSTNRDYDGEDGRIRAIIDCMRGNKTDFAEEITVQIIDSGKPIPAKLNELFEQISDKFNLKKEEDEQSDTI